MPDWNSDPGDDPGGQMAVALAALDSAQPVDTLRDTWPHMDVDRCERFVVEAVPLQNVGNVAQLTVVAYRFVHDVNATWPDLPTEPHRSLLRRMADRFKGAKP